VQQVVYDEVPYINVGKFNSLSAKSTKLSRAIDLLADACDRSLGVAY
jgi:hypothetical protein